MATAVLLRSLRRRETAVLLRSLRREYYTGRYGFRTSPRSPRKFPPRSPWIPNPMIFPMQPPWAPDYVPESWIPDDDPESWTPAHDPEFWTPAEEVEFRNPKPMIIPIQPPWVPAHDPEFWTPSEEVEFTWNPKSMIIPIQPPWAPAHDPEIWTPSEEVEFTWNPKSMIIPIQPPWAPAHDPEIWTPSEEVEFTWNPKSMIIPIQPPWAPAHDPEIWTPSEEVEFPWNPKSMIIPIQPPWAPAHDPEIWTPSEEVEFPWNPKSMIIPIQPPWAPAHDPEFWTPSEEVEFTWNPKSMIIPIQPPWAPAHDPEIWTPSEEVEFPWNPKSMIIPIQPPWAPAHDPEFWTPAEEVEFPWNPKSMIIPIQPPWAPAHDPEFWTPAEEVEFPWNPKPMISFPANPIKGVSVTRAQQVGSSIPACNEGRIRKAGWGCDVIGIDLGITNSYVAVMEGKNPIVIEKIKMVPYKIARAPNGGAWVEANEQQYSPSEIGVFILTKMKEIAEDYLGESVNKAVVMVPAYFNDAQRQAIKDAARIAGLNVQRIIIKPIATALSCGMNKKEGLVTVFDLGSGTFDLSILGISNGVFEVKATNGDTSLGGVDFDNALLQFLVSEFKRTEGIDLSEDRVALRRLREAGEKAKIRLSSTCKTEINLRYVARAKDLNVRLTRSKFEALVNHLIERIKAACESCLKDAGISIKEVDEILLVGGMSHVPKVREIVSEIFGKSPSKGASPGKAVIMGAAIEQIEQQK